MQIFKPKKKKKKNSSWVVYLTFIIAPTAYLGSWAFVVLVIAARFMVYQCPFLLEVLT
jgi:hypothetical protein